VFTNLRQLFRYRALIRSLTARELKARVPRFVSGFSGRSSIPAPAADLHLRVPVVLPAPIPGSSSRSLSSCSAASPWTWFLVLADGVVEFVDCGGNLIRKVLFPAEVLPITRCWRTWRILPRAADPRGVLLYYRVRCRTLELLWCP
jgi:hypothetical protein